MRMDFLPPKGVAGLRKVYGSYYFYEQAKGYVDIDDTWERDNLVRLRNVAGTALSITLHRLLAPLFIDALTAARVAAPDYEIRLLGGFCARHKMNDPKRGLSVHAWGAAVDFNWDTNKCGPAEVTKYDLPAAFIEAFKSRNWEWGGDWKSVKDYMHFQYATGV